MGSYENKKIWSWYVSFLNNLFLGLEILNLRNILMYIHSMLYSVIYNWHGDNSYGLHLEIGDTVQILEQCCGRLILCF